MLANIIYDNVGGDIVKLETTEAYPSDYDELVDYAQQEQQEDARPELSTVIENIEQYDYEHDSKLRDFCDEMAKYCDGHSCEKVLNIVLKED